MHPRAGARARKQAHSHPRVCANARTHAHTQVRPRLIIDVIFASGNGIGVPTTFFDFGSGIGIIDTGAELRPMRPQHCAISQPFSPIFVWEA